MRTYEGLVLSVVVGSMLAGTALGGDVIGTEKALGHIGGYGLTQLHEGRRHIDGHRVARYQSRPAVVQSAVPKEVPVVVAQTPAEGRRFSYAPTPEAPASKPATTTEEPVVISPSVVQPSHYHAARHQSVDKWALPKTDPRKYGSR